MLLAVVVFAYTFLQAAWGGRSSLWIHVPGAMVLTVGVVLVAVTSFRVTTPRAGGLRSPDLAPLRRDQVLAALNRSSNRVTVVFTRPSARTS